ncbi:MAG: phytoene desaturase [Verrucomicrobiales bacterium]|jgi:diapolycopene oxygenase|nr:phytoene desaturase [Verrucomicrobiales bacterium]MBP9223696.1 phytoene desaturase [Verrucomicrobiales bacterium]
MSNELKQRNKKVIVVGAGLGGLAAAISLRAEGFEVEVLEKNEQIGGKLNFKEVEGYGFDLGPSIFTLPQFFENLWERAGKKMSDYVELQPVSPHWRNFFEDGVVLDLYEEPDRMKAELGKLPGSQEQLWTQFQAFLQYGREQYDLVDSGYFRKGLDNVWEMLRHYGWKLIFKMDHRRTMSEAIHESFEEEHLRSIFEYFIKYVGSSAHDAPGYMNLMPLIQFDYGLWYVRGGMYNLARGLGRLLEDLGIALRLNCEVTSINQAGPIVQGITLAGGEILESDYVVCNMEVLPAYRRLLSEPPAFLRKLEKFAPACSGLVIHLGTDRIYHQLAHHNFFYSKNQSKHFDSVFQQGKLPEDPTIYLVAPTRSDPSKAPEGHDNIKILPHIPPINPDKPHTDEEYMALKDRVIDKLERMGLTDLRKHTVVEDVLTPVDLEKMYYSNGGSIYGVVSDWKLNQAFKAPKQSSKYRNLFFTGGSVNPGGGMPMVILCGQKVADRIVRAEAKRGW